MPWGVASLETAPDLAKEPWPAEWADIPPEERMFTFLTGLKDRPIPMRPLKGGGAHIFGLGIWEPKAREQDVAP